MKNRQVFEIHQALQRLDGTPSQTTPGSIIPYRFSGSVAYAIAKNITKTTTIVKDVQEAHQRLLKAILQPGEVGLKKGDPRIEALTTEYENILDIKSDYTPHQFNFSGLNIGTGPTENQIPPSVICALDPLIIDDSQSKPPEIKK